MFKGKDKLQGVHPDLVRVVNRAETIYEGQAQILEGMRSAVQQAKNVAKGVSWTMNSKHLSGRAVDVAPLKAGKVPWDDWKAFSGLARAFKQASQEEGVPIVWGGDWKKSKDGPHYELTKATTVAIRKATSTKFAALGAIGTTASETAGQLSGLTEYSKYLTYAFIVLTLVSICVGTYVKLSHGK